MFYPAAKVDHILHDGERVKLGDVELVAHLTPGHTKGCTTWTTKIKENGKTYQVVIVGGTSLNTGYELVNNAKYPNIAQDYKQTFNVLRKLPCDIFLAGHGMYFDLDKKYAEMKKGNQMNPFVDPEGYKKLIAVAEQQFDTELTKQKNKS